MGFQKGKRSTATHLWQLNQVNRALADSSAATGTIAIFSAPANTLIHGVRFEVLTAVTGSSAETVGDGTDPDGYLEDGFAASTGVGPLNAQDAPIGAFLKDSNAGGTDALDVSVTGADKLYSSADTVDYIITGTATAGKIRFYIDYTVLNG